MYSVPIFLVLFFFSQESSTYGEIINLHSIFLPDPPTHLYFESNTKLVDYNEASLFISL
nr:MAG TPA: hypothetical protein [Bacteriophage sp.]